jgi:hypothetical protein
MGKIIKVFIRRIAKMKISFTVIVALFFMQFSSLFARINISPGVSDVDWLAIEAKVTSLWGIHYKVINIVNVDSALGNRSVADGNVTDPYHTLAGAYVFLSKEEIQDIFADLHGAVGVYKNGDIIWQSDTIINAALSLSAAISNIRDLNNDGKVDIVTSWYKGAKGEVERLWIFSWDGQSGRLENGIDQTNESTLASVAFGFGYFDIDGNDISEIVGKWYPDKDSHQMEKIVYSWNGNVFGKWTPSPQPLPNGFYPRNRISAIVNAIILKVEAGFSYDYRLQSNKSSKQMINEFILSAPFDSISNDKSPDEWVLGGVPGRAIGWLALPGFDKCLKPGDSTSSFYFESCRLPSFVGGLIRGDNGNWVDIYGSASEFSPEKWYDEALSNSFKIMTIGPSNFPTPFSPLDFLDTLASFITQSRSLGWIKDQATADKYLGYFGSAKTSLQQNNTAATRTSLQQALQDVSIDSANNITSEAYALIRFNTEYFLAQLPSVSVAGCNVKLVNSTGAKLSGGSLQYYEGSWKDATNNNDGTFFVNTTAKTLSLRMVYEYGSQTKSNVTVGSDTVVFQTINAQVKLQNSQGYAVDTGSVQFYAGAWRNFGTTSNGIAAKELLSANYSFRMTYAYASKDIQQDIGANAIVVFQTVNAAVRLQSSQGLIIDQGTVQYYSGAWRTIGATVNGVANKELLPNNYSFRMTYAYASKDKQQDIGTNPTVVFQTVNATVQLQNSQGVLMDQGTVQYYSGAWREFGSAANGIASKELLPNNYSFRMTYAYASKDKQQDIGTNATVVFQTANAAVQLQNSQGALIDQGTVQYYSGAWREFGMTTNGVANKELLPNNYSFRMTYAYASKDKQQDIAANSTVVFQTVNATVQLKNSLGNLIDQGTVQYYSGAWRTFGTATNGVATLELLPNNYSFRMTYEYVSLDKSQNLSTNNTVDFSTVLCTIRVKNAQNQPVDGATASYYSGAWRQIGNTVGGEVTKELLPVNLTFRVKYGIQQQDKQQNLSTNSVVEFAVQ